MKFKSRKHRAHGYIVLMRFAVLFFLGYNVTIKVFAITGSTMKNIQHYPIFADENLYPNQINWIVKQIESFKDASFNDLELARSNLDQITMLRLEKKQPQKQLQRNLKLAERNLHGFRNTFLSESGFSKLNTTLKVARKRLLDKETGFYKLDVTVSPNALKNLNELVKATGLTKTAIIEDFLLNSNSRIRSEYEEEQLELDVSEPDVIWHLYTRFSQIKTGTVMRSIGSETEYKVFDLDHKTILFDDGGELDAYQSKKKYEFNNLGCAK
jgi:hypothetical protein